MALKTWQIDRAHSDIFFTVRHMVISKVRGRFQKWDGTLQYDEENPASSRVEITIDAASIDTNEPKRDAHLRSADFLNAEKHPSLVFKSTKIEAKGADKFLLSGTLTIRDITKPVAIDVEHLGKAKDPWGQQKVLFSGKLTIQREEFGATWNQALEAGGVLVGKNVEIDIELQAIAPAA
jgi:polyisoprenoid-binding protein YceI